MIIYLDMDNETGQVYGWGSSSFNEESVSFDLPRDHDFFNNPMSYKVENGELTRDSSEVLRRYKQNKIIELSKACNSAILAGFFHVIDGVEYHFSYDIEAQVNFGDLNEVLKDGIVDEVTWTVRKDGEQIRIPITSEIMKELTVSILMHKQNNISKFRDFLEPQVKDATTIEEVKEITW
ncbi:DUF4376 domain-containing protein [Halobacillus sp. A5]|uniref:DUF4376 domain-containing protein n=1 Tax=Halobacillus sp. A5 TaxID=2880263 RepID=UPI0020A63402|nr:DUF4376 domain-containing protein [Halobacillus sp. A5]MCP3025990.1 DUF4376 domain-containing protein [Halobacillus sp. A5]